MCVYVCVCVPGVCACVCAACKPVLKISLAAVFHLQLSVICAAQYISRYLMSF